MYLQDEALTKEDRETETPPKLPPRAVRPNSLSNSPSTSLDPQVRVEMMALRTDNEELRRQTSNLEVELGQMSEQMGAVMKEKESLMKKVSGIQHSLSHLLVDWSSNSLLTRLT